MKNKNVLIGIGGALIAVIIIFLLASSVENQGNVNNSNVLQGSNDSVALPSGTMTDNLPVYTMAEVATNNDRASCWSVIDGFVYDLTDSIDTHGGGPDNILKLCGTDGSELFSGAHGNSDQTISSMQELKIGELSL